MDKSSLLICIKFVIFSIHYQAFDIPPQMRNMPISHGSATYPGPRTENTPSEACRPRKKKSYRQRPLGSRRPVHDLSSSDDRGYSSSDTRGWAYLAYKSVICVFVWNVTLLSTVFSVITKFSYTISVFRGRLFISSLLANTWADP